MDEPEFLHALRTLPLHPGARGLRDDAAVIGGFVLTTDTLVEGVHFLTTDPAADVAWKLVAVNLSDLAAKGAAVEGVMLNVPLSDDRWDRGFLDGLRAVLAVFAVPLIGGDTVSLPAGAPRVLTCTAIGRDAPAPPRSGAMAGDRLWVTGTIGDAGEGLAMAAGRTRIPGGERLLAAYRRPCPRLADGRALGPVVHAMCDVSDGLLIDAGRMADASGLAVRLDLARMPVSIDYRAARGTDLRALMAAATAGDDYQLLFALPRRVRPPVPASLIGRFVAGEGMTLLHRGIAVDLPDRLGWEHGATV